MMKWTTEPYDAQEQEWRRLQRRVFVRWIVWRADRWVDRHMIPIVWVLILLFSILFWVGLISALGLVRGA